MFGQIQSGNSISISYIGIGIYIKCTGKEDDISDCELFNMTYCSTITTVICSDMCTNGDVRLNSSYTSNGKYFPSNWILEGCIQNVCFYL